MVRYNIDSFLTHYCLSFGKLTGEKEEGLIFLSNNLFTSDKIDLVSKAAYILATIKWETGHTFQPITEYGTSSYLQSKPYYPYIGRGYVQLTWESNYYKFGKFLNIDLVKHPELANNPEYAWQILEEGMTNYYGIQNPNFTSYTLEDYFTVRKNDYYNARRIINPMDYKSFGPIAKIAETFNEIILKSIISEEDIPEARK